MGTLRPEYFLGVVGQAVALSSSGRQTCSGHFMGSWVLVWARCCGWLGAGHITIVVKRTGFRSAAFVAECHKPCTAATCLLPRSLDFC